MASYRFAAVLGTAFALAASLGLHSAAAQQAEPVDDRPPLLSAPPPEAPAPTGAAAAARRTPAPEPGTSTDFFSNAFSDYPPEVVPPSATRRDPTVESSSAVK